jgi:hypothetical protein
MSISPNSILIIIIFQRGKLKLNEFAGKLADLWLMLIITFFENHSVIFKIPESLCMGHINSLLGNCNAFQLVS